MLDGLHVDPGRAAAIGTALLGCGDPLGLTFLAQVGLELGKDAEHVEECFAGPDWCCEELLERDDVACPVLSGPFLCLGDLSLSHEFRDELFALFGVRVVLCCSNAEPSVRIYCVLGDTVAFGVHEPEIKLRVGEPLFGGEVIPAHRLGVVLGDTFAGGVHDPEIVLRLGEPLFGETPVLSEGSGKVAALICGCSVFNRLRGRRHREHRCERH